MGLAIGAKNGVNSHARKRALFDYVALWLGTEGFEFKHLIVTRMNFQNNRTPPTTRLITKWIKKHQNDKAERLRRNPKIQQLLKKTKDYASNVRFTSTGNIKRHME